MLPDLAYSNEDLATYNLQAYFTFRNYRLLGTRRYRWMANWLL